MTSPNYYWYYVKIKANIKMLFYSIVQKLKFVKFSGKEGREMLIITTTKKQKKQDERLQRIAQGYKEQNNELLSQIFDLMIENKQLKKALIKD